MLAANAELLPGGLRRVSASAFKEHSSSWFMVPIMLSPVDRPHYGLLAVNTRLTNVKLGASALPVGRFFNF